MYNRISRYVSDQPWALLPETMAVMLDVLQFRASGERFTPGEIQARLDAARKPSPPIADVPKGVAVIRVRGVICQHAAELEDVSSPAGASAEAIARLFREAQNSSQVGSILFDIDSPGGAVYGTQELADEIYAARGRKPMTAIANSMAASAAFWIASAADELVVTPGGDVGSHGVFSAHENRAKLMEMQGRKIEFISAGRYKVEGNPFEPLSDEARAHMQARVDEAYARFTKALARNRGLSVDHVRENFGEGRLVGAKEAVAKGMADRVETVDQALARLFKGAPRSSSMSASLDLEVETRMRRLEKSR